MTHFDGNEDFPQILDYGHIRFILKLSNDEFQSKMSDHRGRGLFNKSNMETVLHKILNDPESLFGSRTSEIDYIERRTLESRVQSLLSRNATSSVVIGHLISTRSRNAQKRPSTNREAELLDELEELKLKLEFFEPLFNLFKVDQKPTHGNQGRTDTFGYDLDSISLKLLASGQSASSIHDFFTILVGHFPVLIDGKNSHRDRPSRRVPSLTYLERLRDCQPFLNREQTEQFLNNASELVLAYDESPSLNQKNIGSFGAIDQNSKYHCFSLEPNPRKDSDSIANHMFNVLTSQPIVREDFVEKLHPSAAIISDSAPSQVKANHIFLEKIGLQQSQNKDASRLVCCMHTVSNCEKMMISLIEKKDKKMHEASVNLRILFGSRRGSGYHRNCLKNIFASIMNDNRTTFFKTDTGSRFGVVSHNFRTLYLNWQKVKTALQNAKNTNSRAESLLTYLDSCSKEDFYQVGVFALVYYCILSPFHSQTSKNLTWAALKEVIDDVKSKIRRILEAQSSMKELFSLSRAENFSEKTLMLLDNVEEAWKTQENELSVSEWNNLHNYVIGLVKSFKPKMKKDVEILESKCIPSNRHIPSTNRRSESSFALFKHQEARFIMMAEKRLLQNALSSINNLPEWLDELDPSEARRIINAAKADRGRVQSQNQLENVTELQLQRQNLSN